MIHLRLKWRSTPSQSQRLSGNCKIKPNQIKLSINIEYFPRYKDGQEVRADARIKITRDCTRLETYNLTLNLIKREDAGDYEVKASNVLGTASTKSHVKVLSEY